MNPSSNDKLLNIHFTVKDSGIGIEEDKLESIFDRFTQADSSTTRKYGGTGLGLSICKSLSKALGGKIWIESRKGFGTSVHLELPFEKDPRSSVMSSPLRGKSILIINDQDYSRQALAIRIGTRTKRISKAQSMEEGRQFIDNSVKSNSPFDMILVRGSIHGWKTSKTLTELRSLNIIEEKIILITTVGQDYIENFAGSVLLAPVDMLSLENASKKALSKNPELHPSPAQPSRRMRSLDILLVEDNKANCMLIQLFLKDLPHKLKVANNGAEGLELAREAHFDIIFMDIEMPVMDGYESTRKIRAWEKQTSTKPSIIIALTAHALTEARDKIIEAGCDSFLTKPISKDKIISTINELCNPFFT
jgi:two-component system sensor histidine kinase BarA